MEEGEGGTKGRPVPEWIEEFAGEDNGGEVSNVRMDPLIANMPVETADLSQPAAGPVAGPAGAQTSSITSLDQMTAAVLMYQIMVWILH